MGSGPESVDVLIWNLPPIYFLELGISHLFPSLGEGKSGHLLPSLAQGENVAQYSRITATIRATLGIKGMRWHQATFYVLPWGVELKASCGFCPWCVVVILPPGQPKALPGWHMLVMRRGQRDE